MRSLLKPEQKSIGWPEQKYISGAGKKAPELGALSLGIKAAWDYSPGYRAERERRSVSEIRKGSSNLTLDKLQSHRATPSRDGYTEWRPIAHTGWPA